MSEQPLRAGVGAALRRVMVGYRVVGALWLWVLAVVVLVTEPQADTTVVVITGGVATAWTVATLALVARAPVALRSPLWIGIDTVVSAVVIVLALSAARRGFFGGYPFSTVVFAGYGGGYPGGLIAALVLSAVTMAMRQLEAITSALVYVVGAAVTVWAFGVIRRYESERRALEERVAAEHAERVRSQERAETAAALHDSVLQTLALIQRRSDDASEVTALARRQERDLRDWLAGSRGRLGAVTPTTFAGAVKDVAADIERDHRITVEVITVGDAAVDHQVQALVDATRESLVNVAKHAGVESASVYAEVADGVATVYVRDRGAGFDPRSTDADRRGITESIVGRLRRAGGSAEIRSEPGRGTEVELRLPLDRP